MKTRLLCCSLVFAGALAHSEDQKPVSSVQIKGQGSAAGTEIVLNQIAMDQFPAVQVSVLPRTFRQTVPPAKSKCATRTR